MKIVNLPQPQKDSKTSIETAIFNRESVRNYSEEALSLKEVSQILWAAQGIVAPSQNRRTVPSAGALYPLEVYGVVSKVQGIEVGVYHYLPHKHTLEAVKEGEVSNDLSKAALGQSSIKQAPLNLVISADYSVITAKYGERGIMYTHMEAGHSAQNVYLQSKSLELGTVVIGAFDNEKLKEGLNLSTEQTPLYIMPVGKR